MRMTNILWGIQMKTNGWLIKGISHKKLNKEKKKILKKYSYYFKMKSLYRIEIYSPNEESWEYIDCKSIKEVKDFLSDLRAAELMAFFDYGLIINVYKKINSYRRIEIYTEIAGEIYKDVKKFYGKYIYRRR